MIRSRFLVVLGCAVVAAWSGQLLAESPAAPVRQGIEAAPQHRGFVKAAVYRVRLDEQQRMVGTSQWEIVGDGPWPTLLHLAPQDAQFQRAVWLPTKDNAERAAEMGLSAERRPALLVDKPGQAEAQWTLAPRQTEYDRRYRLRLADCLRTRVELTLAADLEVSVDRGLAERAGEHWSETFLRLTLETDGRCLFTWRMFSRNLPALQDWLGHERVIPGLSDAGAHVALISDCSASTFHLTHWARDRTRGERLAGHLQFFRRNRLEADVD